MTELVLRNFDKAVLGKLNLSAEAREAFRKLLGGRVVERAEVYSRDIIPESGNPDAEYGLYNGA
jgi:hypothetical protein